MVRKFPCCGDCGTKLSHVVSSTKSPEGYQLRVYDCPKCDVTIFRIHQKVKSKNELKFWRYVYDFTFKFIRRK